MSNHKRPTQISFDDSLTNEDYGQIIGKNGELKGIWVPDGADSNVIPPRVVQVCSRYFNIDPNAEEHEQPRLH